MLSWIRGSLRDAYVRSLERDITDPPTHIAVIQDGNRRFARRRGRPPTDGHREGAETTEQLLEWCRDLDIKELTLYAFSTENFDRPAEEREPLFDLITRKLRELSDSDEVAEHEVAIRAIGDIHRLPTRVRQAVDYAERQTASHDQFQLNVALAYGGRSELLTAAQEIAHEVEVGAISPEEIDEQTIDNQLYANEIGDVDLIIRTGGDERTSNFLPWHANGNEAAVVFCAPYWPEFSKIDFLRTIRTYEYREAEWRRSRVERGLALVRGFGDRELPRARNIVRSLRTTDSPGELERSGRPRSGE